MLYIITHAGEEYRRIVTFGEVEKNVDNRTLRIIDDSGWQTRDDEIYPINTVIRPEARADQWIGESVLIYGDSISWPSHGGYWSDYLISEMGCTVYNYARGSATFVDRDVVRNDSQEQVIEYYNYPDYANETNTIIT